MNKKMRSLLGKGIVVVGSATLLLSPVYADDTVAESVPIESSQEEVQNSKVSSYVKEYDLNYQIQYMFIPVNIELNGNELVGISNEGQPLVRDRDYRIRECKNDKMAVEIDLSYMARQEAGDLNLTFEFNKGDAQVLTIKLTDETEAELSNLTGEYDRAKSKPGSGYGVGTVLKDNKDSLKGMYIQGKNGEPERELEYEKDYIVTCTMVDMGIWFTEDFLNSLPMGENEIIFRFKYAEPKTFVVNVIDTGKVQDSKVTSDDKECDLNYKVLCRPVTAHIELNGNEFVGISNEGQPLVEGKDYQITNRKEDEMTVEIDLQYIANQPVGDLNLTFEFNKGEAQQITVKIIDKKEAELSRLTDTYDRSNTESECGIGTVLKENKDSLIGMYIQGKDGQPERKLEYEKDYSVTSTMVDMGIWFTDEFLNNLPMGKNEIVFKFKYAEPMTYVLDVIDTGKETSTLKLDLDKSTAPSSNTIINSFKVAVGGEESYDLSKLKIRYYYTADEANEQSAVVDNAGISYTEAPWYEGITSNVESKIVKMEDPTATADTYLELSFTGDIALNNKSTMTVDTRIHKADWSNYDQSNDFSYNDASKVAVFYNDELISGKMPQ